MVLEKYYVGMVANLLKKKFEFSVKKIELSKCLTKI